MMGRSSFLHAGTGPVSIPVRVADEWCPPGVTTLEFDAVFRRTSDGVWYSTYPR